MRKKGYGKKILTWLLVFTIALSNVQYTYAAEQTAVPGGVSVQELPESEKESNGNSEETIDVANESGESDSAKSEGDSAAEEDTDTNESDSATDKDSSVKGDTPADDSTKIDDSTEKDSDTSESVSDNIIETVPENSAEGESISDNEEIINNEEFPSTEVEVVDSGVCGDNLSWILTSDEILTISGSGDMYDFNYDYYNSSEITIPWYLYSGGGSGRCISKIKFEGKITSIGTYAFYDCSRIQELEIPDSIKRIGDFAFMYCNGIHNIIFGNQLETIGNHAFDGLSWYKSDLRIPDSVETIGDHAFDELGISPGSIDGNLIIGNGVKIIGDYAFANCRLTGNLTLGKQIEEIGNNAFYRSYFTGSLDFPNSIVKIGDMAFEKCSSFTGSLIIPENVTSIGYYTFSDCSGLNGKVYIPPSVTSIYSYAFYVQTIYGESGSYAETYALENGIEFISYTFNKPDNGIIEDSTAADSIYIYVLDEELNIPISGALVNGSTADSNGYISLPLTEAKEDFFITATADGYNPLMTLKAVEPNGTYYLSLKPSTGSFDIVRAVAKIGEKSKDVLTDKLYLENTSENIEASSDKTTLTIEARARGTVTKYELIQGNKIIGSSIDGTFSIPIKQRASSNSLTNLAPQSSVCVRATDEAGNTASKTLGIYVGVKGITIEEQEKSGSLSIGSGINFTIPENVPFLGGGSVNYGFAEGLPFDLEVDANGQVKIAINKDKSMSFDRYKEEYDRLAERAQSLSDAAYAFGGTPQSFGGGYTSIKASVSGYGEGYIDMNKPGYFEIKVGVILSGKGSAGYTQYFLAGYVPIYVTVEAGVKVSGELNMKVICENQEIKLDGGVGNIKGKIYLTPKAGVGVDNLLAVGVSGTGECNYLWKPKDDYHKAWLSAYLELYATCFGWDFDIWKSKEAEWLLYETQKESGGGIRGLSSLSAIQGQIYDSHSYTLMDRSYLNQNAEIAVLSEADNNRLVQPAVYPGASPRLIQAGNKLYLFWLQDIPTRTSENRAALVYAISDDGQTWSQPVQVVPEDKNQTADNGFDLYVDGGNIYVCWQDAAEIYESGISLENAIQRIQISYAVIDSASGNVVSHQTVTPQMGCYVQPKICAVNGNIEITWIDNKMTTESGIWNVANSQKLMKWNSSGNQIAELSIGNAQEKIVSMDAALTGTQMGVVYVLDQDGNLTTTSDRVVYYDTRQQSTASDKILLSSSAGMISNVVVENGYYYWYADGNIYYAPIGSSQISKIYETAKENLPGDFVVASDNGKPSILWNAIDQETEKVSIYSISKQESGNWSQPFIMNRTDSEMTGVMSAAYHNGKLQTAYMHTQNAADGSKYRSIYTIGEQERKDIFLNYAIYDNEDFALGQPLPITAEIINKGNTTIESIDITWDDTLIGTEAVNLAVGESKEIVLNNYSAPSDVTGFEEHMLKITALGERDVTDNSYPMKIGYTDVDLCCSQRLQSENTWLDISVLNKSSIATNCTLNIRADEEQGKILYTEDLGNIDGGKGISLTVNLQKYESSYCTYFVEVVPTVPDAVEGNNVVFVYTGYGTDIKGGNLVGEPTMYTVTFDSNGGSSIESQKIEADMSVAEPEQPQREGYHFDGWYLNGTPYNFYLPVTSNITLTAYWTEYETLVSPSASIPTGSTVEVGTKVALTCAAPGADIYYTLDGTTPTMASAHYTEPIAMIEDTVIKAYAVMDGYKDSAVVTFTYYIDVTENPVYVVAFQSNGGSSVDNQEVEANGYAIRPDDPARKGYLFDGWYLDGELFDFATPITKNIILEAKWTECETLQAPKANIESGSSVAKGTKIMLSSADFDATIYYTLDGTTPNTSSSIYTEPIMIEDTVTIMAYAVKEGYRDSDIAVFTYTVESGDDKDDTDDVLPDDIPDDGIIPKGLWIAGVTDQTYTGKAIKPEVRVYDGERRLKEKTDYTISYKNNTKASDASVAKTAPTITVTGKGNYSGRETAVFKILPHNIAGEGAETDHIVLAYNSKKPKEQKPVPVVMVNGRKLRNKTDFEVTYPSTAAGAYKEPGTYEIKVKGKTNYTGEHTVNLTIMTATLMSKTKVSKIAQQQYTGAAITPEPVVKYGRDTLVKGTDYDVTYENNTEIGTATAILSGKGKYAGTKKVTFKIAGTSMSKTKVENLPKSYVYTGEEIIPKYQVTITVNNVKTTLTEGKNYMAEYLKNTEAGTATIVLKGINDYSGTLKKTFKITPYDMKTDTEKKISVEENMKIFYAKGGARPEPVVTYGGKVLKNGIDYTLKYANNKAVTNADTKKQPTLTVTGKKNYKGSRTVPFMIEAQDIGALQLTAADKTFQTKPNKYQSIPKITDTDGKLLKSGTDYEKVLQYTYAVETKLSDGTVRAAGETVAKTDILPNGTRVNVTVTGKGNYYGTIIGEYRIIKTDIAKAKVTIAPQDYTGKEIELTKPQIKIMLGKDPVSPENYEIVSYSNNIRKGTATVIIRGTGDFGGTKKATFKIRAKGFLWWWRE